MLNTKEFEEALNGLIKDWEKYLATPGGNYDEWIRLRLAESLAITAVDDIGIHDLTFFSNWQKFIVAIMQGRRADAENLAFEMVKVYAEKRQADAAQ